MVYIHGEIDECHRVNWILNVFFFYSNRHVTNTNIFIHNTEKM